MFFLLKIFFTSHSPFLTLIVLHNTKNIKNLHCWLLFFLFLLRKTILVLYVFNIFIDFTGLYMICLMKCTKGNLLQHRISQVNSFGVNISTQCLLTMCFMQKCCRIQYVWTYHGTKPIKKYLISGVRGKLGILSLMLQWDSCYRYWWHDKIVI